METGRMTYNRQFQIVIRLFALLTVIEVVNWLSGRMLNQYALVPRIVESLPSIFISPLLHGNIWHFLSNIVPMCLFSFLVLQYGNKKFWWITLFIIVGTGLLVWLLGRSAHHLGASGVVYGYFGFLLLAGFLSGRPKLILISLLVGFFYGGMIFGILPITAYVSWESHMFGFLVGLIAAYWWAKPKSNLSS